MQGLAQNLYDHARFSIDQNGLAVDVHVAQTFLGHFVSCNCLGNARADDDFAIKIDRLDGVALDEGCLLYTSDAADE